MNEVNIALTVLLWAVYFFLHSLLIATSVKSKILSATGWSIKNYRLIYSVFSTVGLLPIFYFLATTPSSFLLQKNEMLQFISLALCTWGIIVIKLTFKNYSLREFLGLKSMSGSKFIKSGLLQYVRHPLYSGTILLFLGFWFFIPNLLNLVSIVCVFAYLFIGIRLEEKKLIEEFGEDYERFKEEVPAVFPDLKRLFSKS